MMMLRQWRLRRRINQWVPLVPGETEHQWEETRLHGCETCGFHPGYKCVLCGRCVDFEQDWGLYQLIRQFLRTPCGGKP